MPLTVKLVQEEDTIKKGVQDIGSLTDVIFELSQQEHTTMEQTVYHLLQEAKRYQENNRLQDEQLVYEFAAA